MTTLKDTLHKDLVDSIKAKDALKSSTLRMTLAAVATLEVAGKAARELSDDEVTTVIAQEAKKRGEAAAAFMDGGRTALADKERAEQAILATYLPLPLLNEEIDDIIADAIVELDVATEGPRAMGKVMAHIRPQVANRADGKVVSAKVRAALAS